MKTYHYWDSERGTFEERLPGNALRTWYYTLCGRKDLVDIMVFGSGHVDSVNCDECILLKMVELAERDTQA